MFRGSVHGLQQRVRRTLRGDCASAEMNRLHGKGLRTVGDPVTCSESQPPLLNPNFSNMDFLLSSLDCLVDILTANGDWTRSLWTRHQWGRLAFSSDAPYLKYFVYSTAFKKNTFVIPCFIHQRLCNCQSRLLINVGSPLPSAQGCTAARRGARGGLSGAYRLGLASQSLALSCWLLSPSLSLSPPLSVSLSLTHF